MNFKKAHSLFCTAIDLSASIIIGLSFLSVHPVFSTVVICFMLYGIHHIRPVPFQFLFQPWPRRFSWPVPFHKVAQYQQRWKRQHGRLASTFALDKSTGHTCGGQDSYAALCKERSIRIRIIYSIQTTLWASYVLRTAMKRYTDWLDFLCSFLTLFLSLHHCVTVLVQVQLFALNIFLFCVKKADELKVLESS